MGQGGGGGGGGSNLRPLDLQSDMLPTALCGLVKVLIRLAVVRSQVFSQHSPFVSFIIETFYGFMHWSMLFTCKFKLP